MPSNPPVVDDLVAEVADRCGHMLVEVGQYLYAPDGTSPVILQGLRKGAKAISLTLSSALVLQDSDLANVSTFGFERILDEAELYCLERVVPRYFRATMKHQEALSSAVVSSGWLLDMKNGVRNRISDLKAICDEPYREPTDVAVVAEHVRGFYGGQGSISTPTPAQTDTPQFDPLPPGYPGYGWGGPYGDYCGYGGWI